MDSSQPQSSHVSGNDEWPLSCWHLFGFTRLTTRVSTKAYEHIQHTITHFAHKREMRPFYGGKSRWGGWQNPPFIAGRQRLPSYSSVAGSLVRNCNLLTWHEILQQHGQSIKYSHLISPYLNRCIYTYPDRIPFQKSVQCCIHLRKLKKMIVKPAPVSHSENRAMQYF